MKFLKACNEIFTSYTPLRIAKNSSDEFVIEYQVDEVYYRFVAINALGDWSIFFDATVNALNDKQEAAKIITNPSIVFSSYLKAFKIFLENHAPQTFALYTINDNVRRYVFDNILRKIIELAPKYKYLGRLTKDYSQRYIFLRND